MSFSWVEPSALQLVVISAIMFVAIIMALFANKKLFLPWHCAFWCGNIPGLHSHICLLRSSPAVRCTPHN